MDFPLLVTEAVKDQADPNMIVVAITGMIIVFAALLILTLFLTALPKILDVFNEYFPPSEHGHSAAPVAKQAVLDEDLVAAMAIALIHHRSD
ncbi:MAG: OadG family protein [Planctomycetota bacterium]|nr:OadG family protein [Planctomycetota bacterium]